MSAIVPSTSCTRIWPPAGERISLPNAILITSPVSSSASEPALVVTRASSARGGATGSGGLLTTTRWLYPKATVPDTGSVAPTR